MGAGGTGDGSMAHRRNESNDFPSHAKTEGFGRCALAELRMLGLHPRIHGSAITERVGKSCSEEVINVVEIVASVPGATLGACKRGTWS